MSIGDNTIAAYAAQLMDLEDALDAAQGDKKFFFENAREAHGADFAKSLKLAVKIARMDPEKRQAADAIDAEAQRMLAIIHSAPRATHANANSVPNTVPSDGGVRPATQSAEEAATVANAGGENVDGNAERVAPETGTLAGEVESQHSYVGIIDDCDPEAGPVDASSSAVEVGAPTNIVPMRRQVKESDPPHPDCLDPERCKGFSNLARCQRCREAAAAGQVA